MKNQGKDIKFLEQTFEKPPGAQTLKCTYNVLFSVQMAAAETQVETKEKTRKVSTTGVSVKKERRKSVILQCAVSGQKDVEITWKKGGNELVRQTFSSKFHHYMAILESQLNLCFF